ncbi:MULTISPECIES: hypothetical protein [unclassified Caballeronia]|uniref:hypothetical protein n=1 Tax=unclassified Caballeronia TaxID=2646786 RepID=UPI00285E1DB9|nr:MULTISPECIES: hypothetical protein [unclassified Caballeronia]MDR5755080.1 hypothetical protein [Caballeronia sp. LZ024]MDR5841557.1 hypothetical protein [Caballeronia sp. LZ031]
MDQALHLARGSDQTSHGAHTLRPETIARGLGWFSIALGLAELVAPRAMLRITGVDDTTALMRLYGLRELACGIGILTARDATPFLWARVGGDVLDLGTLTVQSNKSSAADRARALRAAVNVMGVTALDVYAARGSSRERVEARRAPVRDYSARSGFPAAPDTMRGVARRDFETPRDMRAPDALLPYARGDGQSGAAAANG